VCGGVLRVPPPPPPATHTHLCPPEVPTMLRLRSELQGAVPQPIAPFNVAKADRRNIGVHIGTDVSGPCIHGCGF
jgi:hypothetical protein